MLASHEHAGRYSPIYSSRPTVTTVPSTGIVNSRDPYAQDVLYVKRIPASLPGHHGARAYARVCVLLQLLRRGRAGPSGSIKAS